MSSVDHPPAPSLPRLCKVVEAMQRKSFKTCSLIRMPLRVGNVDPEVQAFVEAEFWNIGPYSNPDFVRSAQQVFERALWRFGDQRCSDLELWVH
jgi:hypothetical protein